MQGGRKRKEITKSRRYGWPTACVGKANGTGIGVEKVGVGGWGRGAE